MAFSVENGEDEEGYRYCHLRHRVLCCRHGEQDQGGHRDVAAGGHAGENQGSIIAQAYTGVTTKSAATAEYTIKEIAVGKQGKVPVGVQQGFAMRDEEDKFTLMYANMCKYKQMYAKVCKCMQKYAKACKSMQSM